MIDELFANDVIVTNTEYMPVRRLCLYCYKEFETKTKFGDKCPEHIEQPDRKLIQKQQKLNDIPF